MHYDPTSACCLKQDCAIFENQLIIKENLSFIVQVLDNLSLERRLILLACTGISAPSCAVNDSAGLMAKIIRTIPS
jgi:hypothetical protein